MTVKKAVRLRPGPPVDRLAEGAVEKISGPSLSRVAGLYRRDLGEDQHDANPGLLLQGSRLLAKVRFRKWRTLTFRAGLRCCRIDALLVLGGRINDEIIKSSVEQFLVPKLAPGDIVIMANLGGRKGIAARRAIRSVSARLFFLTAVLAQPQSHRAGLSQAQTSRSKGKAALC
jgi:hypothetical protein